MLSTLTAAIQTVTDSGKPALTQVCESGAPSLLTAPQLWGPVISATISGLITLGAVYFTLRHNMKRELGKSMLDLKVRQLNELYTPLQLLLSHSKVLRGKMRSGKPDDWRTVDHLDEILADVRLREILKRLVLIGAQIERIILEKSGLVHGSVLPDSFHQYVRHISFLRAAVDADGSSPVERTHGDEYPRDLNVHIEKAATQLRGDIARLQKTYGEP